MVKEKKSRPARVYKDKNGKYYVLNKKQKIYLPASLIKNKAKINIIVNNIVKKVTDRKTTRQSSSLRSEKMQRNWIDEPLRGTTSNSQIGMINPTSQKSILRDANTPFNLYLPYLMNAKFNDNKTLENLNEKLNKLQSTIDVKTDNIKPKLMIAGPVPIDEEIDIDEDGGIAPTSSPARISRINTPGFTIKKGSVNFPDDDTEPVDEEEEDMEFEDESGWDKEKALKEYKRAQPIRDFNFGRKRERESPVDPRSLGDENDEKVSNRDDEMSSPVMSAKDKKSIISQLTPSKEVARASVLEKKMTDLRRQIKGKDSPLPSTDPVLPILPILPEVKEDNPQFTYQPEFEKVPFTFKEYPELEEFVSKGKTPKSGNVKKVVLGWTSKSGKRKTVVFDTINDFKSGYNSSNLNTKGLSTQGKNVLKFKSKKAIDEIRKVVNMKILQLNKEEEDRKIKDAKEGKKTLSLLEKTPRKTIKEGEGKDFYVAKLSDLHGYTGDGLGGLSTIEKMSTNKGKFNTPLWDNEMFEILSPYKNFVGVCMRDEMGKLLERMLKRDIDKFGFVLNLDTSKEVGSHWTSVYVDLEDDKMVCFYDSFGRGTPKDILRELKAFVKKRGLPYMIKFKDNKVSHQSNQSNRCGFYVANFLTRMFKGSDFNDATDFDIYEGEKETVEDEKNFRKFGYI